MELEPLRRQPYAAAGIEHAQCRYCGRAFPKFTTYDGFPGKTRTYCSTKCRGAWSQGKRADRRRKRKENKGSQTFIPGTELPPLPERP